MPDDTPPPPALHVENLASARFRCVYPTCGGICCRNGRPPVDGAEQANIDAHMAKILPLLRPSARRHVEKSGWLTRRVKSARRSIAVEGGWCVFENVGCTLQRAGMAEGDPWKYKPTECVRFPLTKSDGDGAWYVRQWGHRGEIWDLFCLNPREDPTPAAESLRDEVAYAARYEARVDDSTGR